MSSPVSHVEIKMNQMNISSGAERAGKENVNPVFKVPTKPCRPRAMSQSNGLSRRASAPGTGPKDGYTNLQSSISAPILQSSGIKRAVSSFSPRVAIAPLAPSPLSASSSAVPDASMDDVDEVPQVMGFSPTQSIMFPPTERQPPVFHFNAPQSQVQMLQPVPGRGAENIESPISPSQRGSSPRLTRSYGSEGMTAKMSERREKGRAILLQSHSVLPLEPTLLSRIQSESILSHSAPAAPEPPTNDPPLDIVFDRPPTLLPIEQCSSHPDINCVSAETVAALLNGKFSHVIQNYLIIDCRFQYEYAGGHVMGATNFSLEEEIKNVFQRVPPNSENLVVIFYCEFSSYRGPRLCRYLRAWDREMHKSSYPRLYYPQLYVMMKGYCNFFNGHKQLCDPSAYVTMNDSRFQQECTEGLRTVSKPANKPKRSMSWTGGDFSKKLSERF